MLRTVVLPHLIRLVYRLLQFSWRLKIIESPEVSKALANNDPLSFAFWHGDELALLCLLKPYRCCVMTSTSKDGELMDATLKLMGIQSSRGSSTRGGVSALKGILRLSKDGYRPAIAVDGPKGPYHKAKPGIFEIAKVTGGAVVAASCAVSSAFVFKKAWNKTYLPLPFAKIVVMLDYHRSSIPRDLDVHDPAVALHLEDALNNGTKRAAAALAGQASLHLS